MTAAQTAVADHVREFFTGHEVAERAASHGPVEEHVPGYRALCVGPGPRYGGWSYVSTGCWDAQHEEESGHGLEFVIATSGRDEQQVADLLAMIAYYHATPDPTFRLDVGHTLGIGTPWLPGSACEDLLVSLPYPFGPELERCSWEGGHARILWLLPITAAERQYSREHGVDALEQRFDEAAIEFWDPERPSAV